MNIYIVDASVAVKWYVPEIYQQVSWKLLNPAYQLHVPEFFLLEVGNFLGKKQRRGELNFEECLFILRRMEEVPLNWHPDGLLFPKAFEIAYETGRSLYDCLYLSLALTLNGQMVTADLKFYEALKTGPYAPNLLWVEEIPQLTELSSDTLAIDPASSAS